MNVIRKINRSLAHRKLNHPCLWGQNVDAAISDRRASFHLPHVLAAPRQQLTHPRQTSIVFGVGTCFTAFGAGLFVAPMCSNSILSELVHIPRANLHFEWLVLTV